MAKKSSPKKSIASGQDDWQFWAYKKAKTKITMGFGLTLIGTLWWANSTGAIRIEPFWPIMLTLAGLAVFTKGMLLKNALLRHFSK